MISCKQLIAFCFDYLDGALPEDECARFHRHLEQCGDCLTFFETYQRTPEVSREALATQIPPAVKESIRLFLRDRCDD